MQTIPVTQLDAQELAQLFPEVRIADEVLADDEIAREIQHHPHDSLEEAWHAAATSLVVKRLLEKRASEMGLTIEDESQRFAMVLEQELDVPDPDEAACERYYNQNPQRFRSPTLLAVRHILLAAAPDDQELRDSQRQLADVLLAQLADNAGSFAHLAQQFSACESRHQGGQLGQISKGQTVEEFERQIQDLPVGLHASPVESRYGWHLVAIDQRIEGEVLPYQAVKGRIFQMLLESVTRRALKQYLQVLATQAPVLGIDMGQGDSPLMQ